MALGTKLEHLDMAERFCLCCTGFKGTMRNRLQYLYSISVFLGVLVTAYLMMDNSFNARIPYRPINSPQLVMEANLNPGLDSLFEVEKGLGKMDEGKPKQKRIPSHMNPLKAPSISQ